LIGNPEGKRPLRRFTHKGENNITVELREIGCECVDWMHLALIRDQ
jgi:hypothetical protein